MIPPLSRRRRGLDAQVDVGRGERVLAVTAAVDGTVLAGTRDAFYLARAGDGTRRVPWEQVEAAGWDRDTDTFRLSEVGSWGEQRPVHTVTLTDPGRLLGVSMEQSYAQLVCDEDQVCAECAPVYPSEVTVHCNTSGHCETDDSRLP